MFDNLKPEIRDDTTVRHGLFKAKKTAEIIPAPKAVDTWPKMHDDAYYGIVGNIVRVISPQSEADPVALLIQTLAAAGNIIGRCAYFAIEFGLSPRQPLRRSGWRQCKGTQGYKLGKD